MATRMQQRRGTAAQWTAANPILAAGEIGFETDTNKFKMGNGSSAWSALQYFANAAELAAIIDGAPDLLNTLNELAEAIGEDPTFFTTVANNLSAHAADTTSVHGIANTALLATQQNVDDKIASALDPVTSSATAHVNDTTGVHGIADTSVLATNSSVADDIADHAAVTLSVHGIADTSALALITDVTTHAADTSNVHGIEDTQALATKAYADDAVSDHNLVTTNVHGISDAANIVYTLDLNAHTGATTNVHGIADTADLVTTTILGAHTGDTTGVHGIADTADLVTTSMLADAVTPSALGYAVLAGTGLDYDSANDSLNIDSTVATKQYADDAISAHSTDTTSVHGIADTSLLATKAYADASEADAITAAGTAADSKVAAAVAALTKSSVGLGNVDNTSDANKPVSTATQTALDAKASLSGATFTGAVSGTSLTLSGNLTVNGTTTTVNTTNFTTSDPVIYLGEGNNANSVDLGFVASYNDGTYAHQGLVKDSSDSKWKLFKGVTDEPTTTVNFGQGSLDALAVGALEATTVTPSSGVVFSDGTQTKQGVPSQTTITSKTADYTLSSLSERDSMIEVNSSSAVTITVPPNSSVAYPVGTSIDLLRVGSGAVTIAAGSGVTLNYTPGNKLRAQWSSASLFKRSTDTWVLVGDLSA